MFECHAHMVLDGADWRAAIAGHTPLPDMALVRARLEAYRAAGIEYIRDGGDRQGVSLAAAQLAGEYGIEYRTPVFAIHRKGRYGGMVGREFSDVAEFRALVGEVKRLGGDFIKIMYTGILDFAEFGKVSDASPDPDIAELVKIAHGEGFSVMAHVNGADAVRVAVAAGTDSVEHGFYLDEQAMSELASSDTVWVPTVAPVANLIGCGRFPDETLKKIVESQVLNIKRVSELGGIVAPGSDAGAYAVPHVSGTQDEYAYLKTALSDAAIAEGEQMIRIKFKRQ